MDSKESTCPYQRARSGGVRREGAARRSRLLTIVQCLLNKLDDILRLCELPLCELANNGFRHGRGAGRRSRAITGR